MITWSKWIVNNSWTKLGLFEGARTVLITSLRKSKVVLFSFIICKSGGKFKWPNSLIGTHMEMCRHVGGVVSVGLLQRRSGQIYYIYYPANRTNVTNIQTKYLQNVDTDKRRNEWEPFVRWRRVRPLIQFIQANEIMFH